MIRTNIKTMSNNVRYIWPCVQPMLDLSFDKKMLLFWACFSFSPIHSLSIIFFPDLILSLSLFTKYPALFFSLLLPCRVRVYPWRNKIYVSVQTYVFIFVVRVSYKTILSLLIWTNIYFSLLELLVELLRSLQGIPVKEQMLTWIIANSEQLDQNRIEVK